MDVYFFTQILLGMNHASAWNESFVLAALVAPSSSCDE